MQTVPEVKRWQRDEYYRLGAQGFLDGERDELIGGQIITKPPEGPRHAATTSVAMDALLAAFAGAPAHLRVEKPLAIGLHDEPRPDIAVVIGSGREYGDAHPRPDQTLLIMEIADSSQAYDLADKADTYAAAGIIDYWVACVIPRVVIVLRQPVAVMVGPHRDSAGVIVASPTGFTYAEKVEYRLGQSIEPLSASGQPVAVADVLL